MTMFQTVPYLTSESTPRVVNVRARPEVLTTTGGGATGPSTSKQYAYGPGKSRRSYGIHARHIVVSRSVGTGLGPYTSATVRARLVVGSPGQMSGFPVGTVVTYNGKNDWVVVAQVEEKIK